MTNEWYVLRNPQGQYFGKQPHVGNGHASLSYEWVDTVNYAISLRGKKYAESKVQEALTPKELPVGNRTMVRPDYPDMTGAYAVPDPRR